MEEEDLVTKVRKLEPIVHLANKYVRTKEEILRLKLWQHAKMFYEVYYEKKGYGKRIKKTSVIKESDNIEDLIDTLVYIQSKKFNEPRVMELNTPSFYLHDERWSKSIKENLKNKYTYYGAIWTDKGLIYVAKLNEDGEFELL